MNVFTNSMRPEQSVDDIPAVIADLENLSSLATTPHARDVLSKECTRLKALLVQMEAREKKTEDKKSNERTLASAKQLPVVKITNYGWDESDKFVKLYITIPAAQSASTEDVICQFTESSFDLSIIVNGKKNEFTCKDLLYDIKPTESQIKAEDAEQWKYLTKIERQTKEKNTPKFNDKKDVDPQASLMGMMKEMYDSGDDEMKRTIKKAWHESQEKKAGGGGTDKPFSF